MSEKRMRTVFVHIALSTAVISAARLRLGETVIAAPTIPKVWDETALADWATPIAALNVRPTNMSARDYYSMAVENLRNVPGLFSGSGAGWLLGEVAACGPEALNRA
jgi:hypothetical protein